MKSMEVICRMTTSCCSCCYWAPSPWNATERFSSSASGRSSWSCSDFRLVLFCWATRTEMKRLMRGSGMERHEREMKYQVGSRSRRRSRGRGTNRAIGPWLAIHSRINRKIQWNFVKRIKRQKIDAVYPARRLPEDTKMPEPIIVPTIKATALHRPT